MVELLIDRTDCPIRSDDGECVFTGDLCPVVNDIICNALRSAYNTGARNSASEDGLKPCPFCGALVFIEKLPLWRQNGRGYVGSYTFDVRCRNPDCGCSVNLPGNDTIYRTEEEARANAIKAWNRRAEEKL